MRIALLSPGYPNTSAPYDWAFVHARAKLYSSQGQEVTAFTIGEPAQWSFEGISAHRAGLPDLVQAIDRWTPDVIALHGPYFRLSSIVSQLGRPYAVWVHGHEVLWHWGGFRHGNSRRGRITRALKTPVRLAWQMWTVAKFLSDSPHVVFVSDWMRRAAESHTLRQYPSAIVIPNPVDTLKFKYVWSQRNLKHAITARSLNSRKYGVDVAIQAISQAQSAHLRVVGTGSLEAPLKRLAERLTAPVTFSGSFVPHGQMPQLYADYGFFIAASRVEAQGVAMCEAMACGLPVIATDVGGIPEFVVHERNGFLSPRDDARALADGIRRLTSDPSRAAEMSHAAREMVERTCSHHVVVERELSLLQTVANAA